MGEGIHPENSIAKRRIAVAGRFGAMPPNSFFSRRCIEASPCDDMAVCKAGGSPKVVNSVKKPGNGSRAARNVDFGDGFVAWERHREA